MKKWFVVAVALLCSWGVAFSQDAGTKDPTTAKVGFQESSCKTVAVRWNGDKLEACNKTAPGPECFWMFDKGGDATGNDRYSKYCVDLNETIPILWGNKKSEINAVSGNSGVEVTMSYVSLIYKFGSYMIGFICVLVMVVSGVQIIAGGMSPEGVGQAKTRIIAAIASLVLLLSTVMILKTINPNFFGS